MANYKDVELTDGRTVRVYRPPTRRIMEIVSKKYPEPLPEWVKEEGVTGKEFATRLDNDPAYLAAHEAWTNLVNEEVDKRGSLFMFKDENPPDDWDVMAAVGENVLFFDPDWKPSEGKIGRKFDYIQWSILGDIVNSMRILDAQRELSGIELEEVAANEASFRPEVEGETS